jgi:hypothetical protein
VLNAVTKSWHILPALAMPQRVAIYRTSEIRLMATCQTWTHSNAHHIAEVATGVEEDGGQGGGRMRWKNLYSLYLYLYLCGVHPVALLTYTI